MLENEIPQENVVLRWSYRERRSKKTKDSIRTKCWEKKTVNVLDVRQHKSKLSLNFQRTLLSSITIVLIGTIKFLLENSIKKLVTNSDCKC